MIVHSSGKKDVSFSSRSVDDLRSFHRVTGFGGGAAGGGGRRSYSLVCRDRISEAKVDACHCPPLQVVPWPQQLSFPFPFTDEARFSSFNPWHLALLSAFFDHVLRLTFIPMCAEN
ncbi:hypothetical protein Aduo_012251 [Ancylostoma duodenale]